MNSFCSKTKGKLNMVLKVLRIRKLKTASYICHIFQRESHIIGYNIVATKYVPYKWWMKSPCWSDKFKRKQRLPNTASSATLACCFTKLSLAVLSERSSDSFSFKLFSFSSDCCHAIIASSDMWAWFAAAMEVSCWIRNQLCSQKNGMATYK